MALLKSYTCRSCGGVLNFEEDQEIFECPFCGQEFNYTDFHRDELLNQAAKCLKELRYDTAKEKYDTLLSNNPQDFEALRGMVLVQGRICSLDELDSPENIRDCDFPAAVRASFDAREILDGSSEAGYFERLIDLLGIGREFRDKTADALDKSEKAREKYKAAAESEKKSQKRLDDTGNTISIFLTMAAGGFLGIMVLAIGLNITWLFPATLFTFGLVALIALGIFLIHRHKVRYTLYNVPKPSEYVTSGHIIQDFLSEEALEIKRRYMEELELLKKYDPASNGYTPPKAKKRSSADDPFIDITKTVNCAKCGGQLHPDKEKRLFECKYCGVAYGMSLFFNNPMEKAVKAIERADYIEADQRFSHVLMIDPKDFDALLGRILCAGKWKNIENIYLSENMIPLVSKNLKDRIGEAVDHAAGEDRLFFVTLNDLADVLIENVKNEQILKRCDNVLLAAESNSEIRMDGSRTFGESSRKMSDVHMQIEKCSNIKFELLMKFDSLKDSLRNELNRHIGRVSST